MHSRRLQRLLWIYSTALGMPESVGMKGQIDWQAQQISRLVCSLAGQRCLEAWGTFWTWTDQSITALIAWREEEWRKEAADIPPSEERSVFNQTNDGTVFEGNLGETAERPGEGAGGARMGLPSATMPSWAETETVCVLQLMRQR